MLPIYSAELVPTDFALKLRPAFIASMMALVLLVVGKFAIRDWWGAVSLIFVILMGLFVLSGPYRVNASSALFFCVLAVISGIFDIISCVLYFQHSKYKLFDPMASTMALLAQFVFLTSPLGLFVAGLVAYVIFADCRDNAAELLPLRGTGGMDYATALAIEASALQQQQQQQQQQQGGGGGGGGGGAAGLAAGQQQRPVQGLVPFSGVGQRLDGTRSA